MSSDELIKYANGVAAKHAVQARAALRDAKTDVEREHHQQVLAASLFSLEIGMEILEYRRKQRVDGRS